MQIYGATMRPEGIPLVSTVLDFQEGHILHGTPEAIQQFSEAKANHKAQYPSGMRPEDISYYHTPNEELLVLNYTSGTTGFSKGVMLSGNNFAGNLAFCIERNIHPL